MEIEKRYLSEKQLLVISKMKENEWYAAYDLKVSRALPTLEKLHDMGVLDRRDERATENYCKFFSVNIHIKFKLKDDLKIVKNTTKCKSTKTFANW